MRFESEGRHDLGDHVADPLTRPNRRFGLTQLVDGEADLADDVVDVVDRLGDPTRQLVRRHPGLQSLEAQPDTEQLLDHGVVEIAGDAVVVFGHRPPPVGVGELFVRLDTRDVTSRTAANVIPPSVVSIRARLIWTGNTVPSRR